jgi:outer membrane protein TolC
MKKLINSVPDFLLMLSLTSLSAQETQIFSIEDAIKYAQENSISVQQTKLDFDRSKQQVREYTSIGLPQASINAEYNYNINLPTQLLPDFLTPAVVGTLEAFQLVPAGTGANLPEGQPQPVQFGTKNSFRAGFNVNQLVFDGSYFVGLKAAKGLVQMTSKQTDLSLQEIKNNVKKSYLTVLIAEENRKILLKNIDNLEKLLKETKAFKESGLIEQLDVDRLELSLSNLKSEYDMVGRQVELAYNVLKFQMNFPIYNAIALSDSLGAVMEEPSDADLNGKPNFESRFEVQILKQSEYLNELNVQRYKMGYAPSVSAFFTHQYQIQRNKLFDKDEAGFFPITIIGASVNVPIFDGFNKDSKIKMAEIDRKKINLQLKQFELASTLELENARVAYKNAKERLSNQQKNLDLADRILNTTKIKYKEGIGSSMEITTAEQELYRTQANYMNAVYDVAVAKADLDRILGK